MTVTPAVVVALREGSTEDVEAPAAALPGNRPTS